MDKWKVVLWSWLIEVTDNTPLFLAGHRYTWQAAKGLYDRLCEGTQTAEDERRLMIAMY